MASPAPIDAEGVLGPWLIGALVSSGLAALVISETFSYFITYRKDRLIYKLLVAFLFAGSMASVAINIAEAWYYLITTRNDNTRVGIPPEYQRAIVFFPVWSIFWSQCYFAHRCWLFLQKNIYVGAFLAILILTCLGSGLADFIIFQDLFIGIGAFLSQSIVDRVQVALQLSLWSVAVSDLVISGILAFKLREAKQNFNDRTDSLLRQLIHLAMTSAAFTASISIADAVVFAITSLSSNAHLALYVLHPSTYALTTIFTLNARERLKDELNNSRTPVSGSRNITEATTPKASSYKLNNLAQRSAQGITVHVATQSFRDDLEKNPIEKDPRAMEMDSDHRFAI